MGRIRTQDVKDVAHNLIEAYPDKFSDDFQKNKEIIEEMKLFPSKRYRNRVAGYVTRIAKRLS